jgi:hypothetical protein
MPCTAVQHPDARKARALNHDDDDAPLVTLTSGFRLWGICLLLSHIFSTGRLTDNPIGGEAGRAVERAWEAAAAAMPQPLSFA